MGHRMRGATAFTATFFVMALLSPIARAEEPPLTLALSDGQVRRLEQELRSDLDALDAFARRRPAGALSGAPTERPGSGLLYGRVGPRDFRNGLQPQSPRGTPRGWGRTAPPLPATGSTRGRP